MKTLLHLRNIPSKKSRLLRFKLYSLSFYLLSIILLFSWKSHTIIHFYSTLLSSPFKD
jgi:hypothetical protein